MVTVVCVQSLITTPNNPDGVTCGLVVDDLDTTNKKKSNSKKKKKSSSSSRRLRQRQLKKSSTSSSSSSKKSKKRSSSVRSDFVCVIPLDGTPNLVCGLVLDDDDNDSRSRKRGGTKKSTKKSRTFDHPFHKIFSKYGDGI